MLSQETSPLRKMPAKPPFCRLLKVYQTGRSEARRARPKLTAFCTLSRRFSSSIDAAISAARRRSSAVGAAAVFSADTASPEGSGPAAKRTFGTPRRSAISAARCPSSNAQTESAVATCKVPSRAIRAGQALRAIAAPTTSGQRSTSSARPAWTPKRESSRRSSSDSLSRGHLHDLRRLDRQCRGLRRRDERLLHAGDPGSEDAAATNVELRQDVVEEQQRTAGDELGLGEEQGEQREPLLPLRAEAAQVTSGGRDPDVCEMRTEPRRAAHDVGVEAGGQRLDGRCVALVGQRRPDKAEFPRSLAEPGLELRQDRTARIDQARAEIGEALRPRLKRVAAGEAELHAAE